MAPELPSFLRRRVRLHEARKALLGGAPETALACLDDRALLLSEEADRLRERVLDVLCREALRVALEGEAEEAERRLALVDARDPERAASWRRRLAAETEPGRGASRSGLSRGGESQILSALEGLLAEMRTKRAAQKGRRAGSVDSVSRRATNGRPAPASADDVHRFHLAVDDAGEFLVVTGEVVVLGHAQAGQADLPFLANLDSRHASLRRHESFHGGPAWTLQPHPGQRAHVDGRRLGPEGATLANGSVVELASNLAFRFRAPEPGSGSALLELMHGAECAGAQRVLLLAPGPSGRMRFGTRARRHVVLQGQECEVTLELQERELVVSSSAGLRARPGADEALSEVRVPCPPTRRVDFTVGTPLGSRPPFGFTISPLEDPS